MSGERWTGTAGDDRLDGGGTDDATNSSGWNDLSGGDGNDTFVFRVGCGTENVIRDFTDGDKIEFIGLTGGFADLKFTKGTIDRTSSSAAPELRSWPNAQTLSDFLVDADPFACFDRDRESIPDGLINGTTLLTAENTQCQSVAFDESHGPLAGVANVKQRSSRHRLVRRLLETLSTPKCSFGWSGTTSSLALL